MKHFLVYFGSLLLIITLLLAFIPSSTSQALPEYSAQTGEPCATCHISPSGGGPRGPRGQAWVASSKPGAVPDLVQSLELLGVELTVNPDDFLAVGVLIPPAEPLGTTDEQSQPLFHWLGQYDGN